MDLTRLKKIDITGLRTLSAPLKQPWEGKWGVKLQGQAVTLDDGIRVATPVSFVVNATALASITQAIRQLPGPGESIHMWIGGKHSMGHIFAAILELSQPAIIEDLHTATLAFSKDNVNEWCSYLDSGKLKNLSVVCSKYFEKTSPDIYDHAVKNLRPRGAKLTPIRSHCKIIAAKLSDGQTITAEGSANTRSAKTVEQVALFGNPAVYAFHVRQMERATQAGAEMEKEKKREVF